MPGPHLETDDIEQLRRQFKAWIGGVHARLLGLTVPDCPFQSRTAEGDSWEDAFDFVDRYVKLIEAKNRK